MFALRVTCRGRKVNFYSFLWKHLILIFFVAILGAEKWSSSGSLRKNTTYIKVLGQSVGTKACFGQFFGNNMLVERHENYEIDLPLFGDSGQTSQDSCVSDSRSPRSRDVCPNSPKSDKSISQFWIRLTYRKDKCKARRGLGLPGLWNSHPPSEREKNDTNRG